MGGMLRRLEVQNLAVIREAALDFAPGLNVLTGETGAGKSLLVDALALLLGGRAEGLIGPYGESLLVTAFFEGPPGEAVLSRRVGARSTPRVDGEVVTLKELQAEAERRLSLHAQHTALALLSPRRQREALDALLPEGLLAAYQEAYARREALLKEKAALEESLKARAEREDLLRYQIREIEEARVRPGEEEELLALAERLRHLETIRERLARALALLTEREAQDLLALAAKEVRAAARHDPALEALAEELSGAAEAVRAVARELEDHLEGLDLDPEELDRVEARLSLLERLKRKYGPTLADVLAHAQKAREELARMEGGEEAFGGGAPPQGPPRGGRGPGAGPEAGPGGGGAKAYGGDGAGASRPGPRRGPLRGGPGAPPRARPPGPRGGGLPGGPKPQPAPGPPRGPKRRGALPRGPGPRPPHGDRGAHRGL